LKENPPQEWGTDMMMNPLIPMHSPEGILMKILPGADRKRSPGLYCYRVTYRHPAGIDSGCVMTWEVTGGRGAYQIALERVSPGSMKWHCTCADAVYRGEQDPNHVCKHVSGLLECLPLAA
jgi:hypothetical protein